MDQLGYIYSSTCSIDPLIINIDKLLHHVGVIHMLSKPCIHHVSDCNLLFFIQLAVFALCRGVHKTNCSFS